MPDYFVGVDGGTTKTIALVADEDGHVVGAGRRGNSNWSGADVEVPMAVVIDAVRGALAEAGVSGSEVASGAFCLAGADWPEDHSRQAVIEQAGIAARVTVKSDSFGGLRAGTRHPYGVAVAAGTGINAAAIAPDGREWVYGYCVYAGGGGGGGGDLGDRAVQAVLLQDDRRGPPTALTEMMLTSLGDDSPEAVLRAIVSQQLRRHDSRDVCPLVFAAAYAGDAVAAGPDAWVINYTNPSGIMAEALGKHSSVNDVGLCSGPDGWMKHVTQLLGAEPRHVNVDWLGLNHLGFITRVWVDGKDATERAIDAVADNWAIDGEWVRILGAIPASYLVHYYHHDRQLAKTQEPGYRTRGETLKDLEAEMLQVYADPTIDEKPALLAKRGGGGYADVAFAAMRAIRENTPERQVVQVLNQGALDGIPADASVEVSCLIDGTGPHPLCLGAIPLPIRGLIQAVKAYESLTVQAAVEGSKRVAM